MIIYAIFAILFGYLWWDNRLRLSEIIGQELDTPSDKREPITKLDVAIISNSIISGNFYFVIMMLNLMGLIYS